MAYKSLIYDVLNYYRPGSVEFGDTRQIRCPFSDEHKHGDFSKSARVYERSNSVYCFMHGESWDAVGIVKKMEEIPTKNAKKFILDNFNVDLFVSSSTVDYRVLRKFEDDIVDLVIRIKPNNYQEIYKRLDEGLDKKDVKILKGLYDKLYSCHVKNIGQVRI